MLLAPGTLVRIPLGRQTVSGVVMALAPQPDAARLDALRPIAAAHTTLAPLAPAWLDLMQFVARYYQRALGEVIGAGLPSQLRNRQPRRGNGRATSIVEQELSLHRSMPVGSARPDCAA